MILHTFFFRWKAEATPAHKQRALHQILGFQGQVPGLLETYAGENFSQRSNGHGFAGVMKFTDRAALDAYAINPLHVELLTWLVPLIEATEVDFEV